MDLSKKQRETIIDKLVTNCDCKGPGMWVEGDREALNEVGDERLIALDKARKHYVNNEAIAQAAVKGVKTKDVEVVFNAEKNALEIKPITANDVIIEDDDDEEAVPGKKKEKVAPPMMNQATKKPTLNEWLADPSVPDEVKAVVRNSQKVEAVQRTGLIQRITANSKFNPEWLKTQETAMLQTLAAGLPGRQRESAVANYEGAAGGPEIHNQESDEPGEALGLPVFNAAESASPFLVKQLANN